MLYVWADAGSDPRLERRGPANHVRVEDRVALRIRSTPAPAFQRGGQGTRTLRAVTMAPRSSPSTRISTRFNTNTISRTVFRRAGLFSNKASRRLLLETNFVADAVNLPLISARSAVRAEAHPLHMARGSMTAISPPVPTGTYKKGHAHGPGAHVVNPSGEGYSYVARGDEPRRYEWQVGTMNVPPNSGFTSTSHGHGAGALPSPSARGPPQFAMNRVPKAWISRRLGRRPDRYADEQPAIRKLFTRRSPSTTSSRGWKRPYRAELGELRQARDAFRTRVWRRSGFPGTIAADDCLGKSF